MISSGGDCHPVCDGWFDRDGSWLAAVISAIHNSTTKTADLNLVLFILLSISEFQLN
jgi:hypothetical protein